MINRAIKSKINRHIQDLWPEIFQSLREELTWQVMGGKVPPDEIENWEPEWLRTDAQPGDE